MSDHTGFLVSDVGRMLRREFDVRARAIGITRPQWRMLTTLVRNEGANQGKLADLLDVEPISLCRMIDRLAEAGFVERRTDPSDRRAWLIFLTEKARPILADLRRISDELLAQVLAGLSDAEQVQLDQSLEFMRNNLRMMEENGKEIAHG